MKRLLIAALALFAVNAAMAAPEVGKPAPDFTTSDHNGNPVRLSDFAGKAVVLEWHNAECPFVKKHYGSGNMQKLQGRAAADGIVWLTINSGAEGKQGYMNQSQAADFMKNTNHLATHYLVDVSGEVGKSYAAKTTPHMFVIDKQGMVAYMGAIDDKPTADAKDIEGAKNYVSAALDSLAAGTPVEAASTQPYGCAVKYAD